MQKSGVAVEDKLAVLNWFEKHCPTSKDARTRKDILPYILIWMLDITEEEKEHKDRYFRRIAHELIHEGHLCSSNAKGYWFCPLWTTDKEEIKAIKSSLLERKSKAMAMIADVDRQIRQVARMEETVKHGQQELALP